MKKEKYLQFLRKSAKMIDVVTAIAAEKKNEEEVKESITNVLEILIGFCEERRGNKKPNTIDFFLIILETNLIDYIEDIENYTSYKINDILRYDNLVLLDKIRIRREKRKMQNSQQYDKRNGKTI